jgi:chaperonin GroEL
VAVIKVGAASQVEMIEKKHRVEDALEAVRSGQEMGMIPGGGSVLARLSNSKLLVDNKEQQLGINIVLDSLKEPLRQMSLNAGESPDLIQFQIESAKQGHGYNFLKNRVEDLFASGIVDPVKVTISAVENATSVASTLITTNYAIVKH